jgi:pSer/pThr/pTyr-binding forkhead associated (FHA) protein
MSDEMTLVVRAGGATVRVEGRTAVVGRSRGCDLRIDESGVSRRHCEVMLRDDGVRVRDLGSTHGTWTRGRRVISEATLRVGDVVSLGERGPQFEVVEAICGGRRVLEATRSGNEPTLTGLPSVAAPEFSRGRFLAGLACGLAAGAACGAAALAILR